MRLVCSVMINSAKTFRRVFRRNQCLRVEDDTMIRPVQPTPRVKRELLALFAPDRLHMAIYSPVTRNRQLTPHIEFLTLLNS